MALSTPDSLCSTSSPRRYCIRWRNDEKFRALSACLVGSGSKSRFRGGRWQNFFGDRADHNGAREPWTKEITAWEGYQLVFIGIQRQLITLRCALGGNEGSAWDISIWFITHFGSPTGIISAIWG